MGHHWLPLQEKKYRCARTALFPTFFRISSFVFSRTKTFIQVWNYLRVSKWWQNFHFWVNYPFKQEGSTSQCVLCSRVLPSSFFQGSLARPVSTRTQVRSLRSWNWETANTVSQTSAAASVSPLAFAVLRLAVIKQRCIAAVAPSGLGVNCLYSS